MASAAVPLVNRALVTLLGSKPITDLTDNSTSAKIASTEYEACVRELLQAHDWNFASVRVANLPVLASTPEWGYAFAYPLPGDCLRVRATSLDVAEDGQGWPWQVEEIIQGAGSSASPTLVLVTDAETVSIRYTARISEGRWAPAFATAVVFELAARMAWAITQRQNVAQALAQSAPRKLALARALDGQEGTPRQYITTALTRERA